MRFCPGRNARQRQEMALVAEAAAGRGREANAARALSVHLDDDLGLGAETRRVAAGKIERDAIVIRGEEIVRQSRIEADAQGAADQLLRLDPEIAEGERLAIGIDGMAARTRERLEPVGRAEGRHHAELRDRKIEVGVGLAGNHDGRPPALGAGHERNGRTGDLVHGRLINPAGDLSDLADDEVEPRAAGAVELDDRLGEPAGERDALDCAAEALDIVARQQVLGVEHDADRHRAVGTRADRGDVGELRDARGGFREQKTGLGRIDARPQLLGCINRAVDPMPVMGRDADRIPSFLEEARGNVELGKSQAVGGAERHVADPGPVHGDGERAALGQHRHRGERADAKADVRVGLAPRHIDRRRHARLLTPQPRAARRRRQTAEQCRRRLRPRRRG